MNYQQNIDVFFKAFNQKFNDIIPNIIAETATEYYQFNFKKQSFDGTPWQPLSANYAKRKTRGRGRILTATGKLQRSIRPTLVTPAKIVISAGNTNVPYARVHNEGLRVSGVRSVRTYKNRNFMGKGKPVQIKAHSRTVNFKMPKRQFIGVSNELNKLLHQRLTKALNA
jgi:phage gpG-like protein